MQSRSKYTKELLGPIVAQSSSIAQTLRLLGLKPTGGNYRYLNGRLRALEIDISHFRGQCWNRGMTKETSSAIRKAAANQSYSDEAVFVENCPFGIIGTKLATRLIRMGRAYKCATCGINEWQGSALTLHLDHINGVNNDHRVENLRFLCPNCHQQTSTWGKSAKQYPRSLPNDTGETREVGPIYLVNVPLQ